MTEDRDGTGLDRKLTRRQAIGLLGAAGLVLVVGCNDDDDPTATSQPSASSAGTRTPSATAAPAAASTAAPQVNCVITPELTEGPYFVDEMLNRSDIRVDPSTSAMSEGIPLTMALTVSSVTNGECAPLEGAIVDVWHCDADGVYSDISGGAGQRNTSGEKFLRGYQVTDANGQAAFLTIFPGWYSGRTPHIHFKVRTDPDSAQGTEFTSQFFFDSELTEQIYQRDPYASRGSPDTPNSRDNIFSQAGGDLTLALVEDGDGYSSQFHVGVGAV